MLDMESVSELTGDTFSTAVAQEGLTVVLFYIKCEWVFSFLFQFVLWKVFCLFESSVLIMKLFLTKWRSKWARCRIFSLSCAGDAVSMACLQSYVEVADALEGKEDTGRYVKPHSAIDAHVYLCAYAHVFRCEWCHTGLRGLWRMDERVSGPQCLLFPILSAVPPGRGLSAIQRHDGNWEPV